MVHHYTDLLSVKGVAQALAFSIGVAMGGKRPRTLTAIKLSHCMLKVGTTKLAGECVLVPQVRLKFVEEKFDDEQGPRECCDVPHSTGYQQDLWTSVAFWMYRLLVMRGVFEQYDPILTAAVGDSLKVRPECEDYFLFCDMKANYWIDTAPCSVDTLSAWNKTLLQRMGSEPRGYSAHRSGFVSRACILAVIRQNGLQLPEGVLTTILRAGGWQAVTGIPTVLRVYARKVLDQYIDMKSLSLGRDLGPEVWQQKFDEYLGRQMFPEQTIVDPGRAQVPMQLRLLAWRS